MPTQLFTGGGQLLKGGSALLSKDFSPKDVGGLQLYLLDSGPFWQDSARTTGASADADPIGAWDDLSGNGRHVTQATSGKRPQLKLSIQNGKSVVRFDGTDDYLGGLTNVAGLAITGDFTIFAAFTRSSATYACPVSYQTNAGSINAYEFRTNSNGPSDTLLLLRADGSSGAEGGACNLVNTVGTFNIWTIKDASKTITFWRDTSSETEAPYTHTPTTDANSELVVGNRRSGGSYDLPCLMDVAAVLVYDSALSDTDRTNVRDFLNARYATY
jgi:hypothetical protein